MENKTYRRADNMRAVALASSDIKRAYQIKHRTRWRLYQNKRARKTARRI